MNHTIESLSQRICASIRTRIEGEVAEIVSLNDEDAAEMMLVRHAEGSARPGPAPRAAGCGTRDRAMTVPSEARITALVAEVPTSIPR